MTFIALAPKDEVGRQQMAGEVRAVCDPDNLRAEFSMQIASAWQGKGLGRMMLRKLVSYLRARGTTEIVGQCLPENAAMGVLARELGFELTASGDTTTLRLTLR